MTPTYCAVCGAVAPIATHYALPEIRRTPTGYTNLVACSPGCREIWQARRALLDADVLAAQASEPAQRAFVHSIAARTATAL